MFSTHITIRTHKKEESNKECPPRPRNLTAKTVNPIQIIKTYITMVDRALIQKTLESTYIWGSLPPKEKSKNS